MQARNEVDEMIKIERDAVMNFENAIRGARNPMNSWNRMDSYYTPLMLHRLRCTFQNKNQVLRVCISVFRYHSFLLLPSPGMVFSDFDF